MGRLKDMKYKYKEKEYFINGINDHTMTTEIIRKLTIVKT